MEKVIYALWRTPGEDRATLNARLKDEVAPALLALPNVRALRLNLQDADVARAEPLRQLGPGEPMDGVAQVWLDVSHAAFRRSVDDALAAACARIDAWLVTESTIIPNTRHPSREGTRTEGWSQFCFIRRPERFSPEEWLYNWQALHTSVGIETQGNFEYVQHVVVRPLTEGAFPYAGIVEECFPTAAMDDPHVFFDAVGDETKFATNTARMAESCARFIEMPGGIHVLPTSQYEYRKLA